MFGQNYTLPAFVLVLILLLGACGGAPAAAIAAPAPSPVAPAPAQAGSAPAATGPDADGDGIPDDAERVLGTDPTNPDTDGDGQNDLTDANPLFADNPITESSTTVGFKLDSFAVENNVDAAGQVVADHIELKVSNAAGKAITDFDIYYTFTDTVTGAVQAYYRTLPGFTLQPGESKSLHLDNSGAADHFNWNPNSVFFSNANQLAVSVTLHAAGYAPQTATAKKDAAGAEGGGD